MLYFGQCVHAKCDSAPVTLAFCIPPAPHPLSFALSSYNPFIFSSSFSVPFSHPPSLPSFRRARVSSRAHSAPPRSCGRRSCANAWARSAARRTTARSGCRFTTFCCVSRVWTCARRAPIGWARRTVTTLHCGAVETVQALGISVLRKLPPLLMAAISLKIARII